MSNEWITVITIRDTIEELITSQNDYYIPRPSSSRSIPIITIPTTPEPRESEVKPWYGPDIESFTDQNAIVDFKCVSCYELDKRPVLHQPYDGCKVIIVIPVTKITP